ncbi:NDP-sugar synthase [bacterium]|nr:NDP-sugar synthase [bacterium]
MRTAVVLIGGLGTRLYPLTDEMPKAAVPLLDKPIILYLLQLFKEAGISRIVLCLGHGSEDVLDLFEKNDGFSLEIIPVFEDNPLGTGGALKNAYHAICAEKEVLVANGDIVCNIDLQAMLAAYTSDEARVCIATVNVPDPSRYGLIKFAPDGRICAFQEKTSEPGDPPYFVNSGIYILDPALLEDVDPGNKLSLERDLFPAWILNGVSVIGFEHRGYWRDIGTLTSYWRAHFEILHHYQMYDPAFGSSDEKGFSLFKRYIYINKTVKLNGKPKLDDERERDDEQPGLVVLMRGCEVGDNASLWRTIALPFAKIGAGAVVENCIVGPEVEIKPDERVSGVCITKDKRVPFDTWEE